MEHFLQRVWLITSISVVWTLTVTSSSKAFSLDQPTSSSVPSHHSGPAFISLSLRSSEGKGSDKCCENGGLCVMSVFCFCKEDFYGFKCEYKRLKRPCGPIQDMQWARLGCNLCRCIDSNITCLSHVYAGCDGQPAKENIDLNEYKDYTEIFPLETKTRTNRLPSDSFNGDYYNYSFEDDDTTSVEDDGEANDNSVIISASDSSGVTLDSLPWLYWRTISVWILFSLFQWLRILDTDMSYVT